MTAKELREKRAKLADEMKKLGDDWTQNEQRWKDAEQEGAWKRLNADYDAVVKQLDEQQRNDDIQQRLTELRQLDEPEDLPEGEFIPGREDTRYQQRRTNPQARREQEQEALTLMLSAWCRSQVDLPLSKKMKEYCRARGFNPKKRQLTITLPDTQRYRALHAVCRTANQNRLQDQLQESRALSAYTLGAGGATVPDSFVQALEVNMLAFGGVRQVAETMVTSGGETISWPTADDTSNTGQQLGESASIGSSVDPTFSAVQWNAFKFSSKPVLVPYELLQDSAFNIPALLGQMLGERLGRITNTRFTTGSGANTARGIVTASVVGATTAGATAITADEIFNLVHSVDPAYRSGASFMFHDNILLYLRKLKDAEGRYLWQQGLQGNEPDRILGYSYTINQDMQSSVATATKTMLFGQLSKYKIRRVGAMRLYRLEERYRDNDQDGFVALIREDGNLLSAGTAPVKHLLQA